MNAETVSKCPSPGAVVGEDALLRGSLDLGQAGRDVTLVVPQVAVLGQGDRALEHVERGSRVASGHRDEVVERVGHERHAALRAVRTRQSTLRIGQRGPDDDGEVSVLEWLETPDAQSREKCAD